MAVNRFVLNGMSFHGHGAINEIPGIDKSTPILCASSTISRSDARSIFFIIHTA